MSSKKNRTTPQSIPCKTPEMKGFFTPLAWLPQDAAHTEVYKRVLRMYAECLKRNAPAENRQHALCAELIACWSGKAVQSRIGCYEQEYSDFILSVFHQSLEKGALDAQQAKLLSKAIAGRTSSGECRRRLAEIKSTFRDGSALDSKRISTLRQNGFEVIKNNNHIRLLYGAALFVVSATPSDVRCGKKNFSLIKNVIDVECCYMI